ncbi:phosphoribosyltransferase family protein [Propylenella binzhouense]|uniref:Phosphoribosyltransferase n=1 Tax=Propylenella binzhouense TaxID=2555902 RepID=A0A964T4F0_9HYPH|nr:phosphoribosyltransferase [Propylenella binzhouense]
MRSSVSFADRRSAGIALAGTLKEKGYTDPVVLALPRGGVPVALEIARALEAPLDLLLVRKIGVPWQPELAAAAIVDGSPPDVVRNEEVIRAARLGPDEIKEGAEAEAREIERRRAAYLAGREPLPVAGRTVIVVDDGIATGTTVRAALVALRRRGPSRLVLAVPVAPAETLAELAPLVDEIVCLATPEPFWAIGAHYDDFSQLEDEEVVAMLAEARRLAPGGDRKPA